MKKFNLNDIGVFFLMMACILAIANIWLNIPRDFIYLICLASITCNWAHATKRWLKYSNLYLLKQEEVLDILWSYRDMGRYIKGFKIPELNDIDLRIENEIKDVKVRKERFAENLGIKEDVQGEGL